VITLVRAAFVIGYADGDHVIWRDGEVAFEDNRIIFVGRGYDGRVDRLIDAGQAIISPGFIDLDALADIDHSLLDTWHSAERATGLDWSEDYFAHRRHDVFSPEDRDFRHEFAFTQLIRNGITTAMPIGGEMHNAWCETYDEWAAASGIAARLGLRLYAGPSYRSGVNGVRMDGTRDVLWDPPLGEAGLRDAIRFVEDFDGAHDGLIRACLLPARIETLTPELMRKTAEAQRRLGMLVRLHCLQGRRELDYLRQWYGKGPLDLLAEAGLLGPNLLIPHAVFVGGSRGNPDGDLDDLARLAQSGATVIHCPMATNRFGGLLESFGRYRAAGVNMAMGTDTYPPDMIRVMDAAIIMARTAEQRSDAVDAAEIFRAATLGGARALQRDDLGRLAPGALADMVIVDLADPRVGAVDDPIRTLLLHGIGANVRTVIINGRIVMEDRVLPSVDAAAMHARVQDYHTQMKAAYTERDWRRRSLEDLFPPSFRTL